MMVLVEKLVVRLAQILFGFTYYYPLCMAYLWSIGAVWFYVKYERGRRGPPQLRSQPLVSIIIPCFNEEDTLRETLNHLLKMDYPNYELIAVNDGSTDATAAILDEMALQHSRLRVIHHSRNQGKSIALNTAAYLAGSDYIIGIDADSLLDHQAIPKFLQHFERNPRVGAVTGNPRIRTRSTMLGRLQVGEFSSMIGLIKRAQRMFYRRIFTASGVISAFRRSALHDVGYWSPDMLTEDMDMTWKLQLRGWEVMFEPGALAWILMPETLRGLWKQRLRWAMGGLQIIRRYKSMFLHWRQRGMWTMFLEHAMSVLWACTVSVMLTGYAIGLLVTVGHLAYSGALSASAALTTSPDVSTVVAAAWASGASAGAAASAGPGLTALLPENSGVIIATTCLLQILLGLLLDRRYDRHLLRYYASIIWYPFGFWLMNTLTIVAALPKLALRKRGARARWVSPDRGVAL